MITREVRWSAWVCRVVIVQPLILKQEENPVC